MYTPPFNRVDDELSAREMVAAAASGWFVTVGDGGVPEATLLPVMWVGDRLIAHMAKANDQWRHLSPGKPVLVICGGPEAYVSPSWYATKREHGRVVPTWNYTAVHLTGTIQVHEDPEWLRSAVTVVTDTHEVGRADRWQVSDAPADYVNGQLRGIVGIEVAVSAWQAKAKLSQNRSSADQAGVVAGLRSGDSAGAHAIADAMADLQGPESST